MSIRSCCLLLATCFAAACGPKSGDACTKASDCGSSLSCVACNVNADAGQSGTCQKTCTSDADCAGSSGELGSTPKCYPDTCGNEYCGPNLP